MSVQDDIDILSSILNSSGALVFGDFQLSSGHKSPYYLDLGVLYSYPNEYMKIVEILARRINEKVSDDYVVVGVPLRGLPYAVSVAHSLGKPFIIVRKEAKGHGMQRLIEGRWRSSSKSIVIDDVASTGGNILRAITGLSTSNLLVSHAFVVVDRLQGARENLRNRGVTLESGADILQVIESLKRKGNVSDDEFLRVHDYLQEWSRCTTGQ